MASFPATFASVLKDGLAEGGDMGSDADLNSAICIQGFRLRQKRKHELNIFSNSLDPLQAAVTHLPT